MWAVSRILSVGVLSLLASCSFDTTVALEQSPGQGADAGFFSPDARPAPDAERSFSADATPAADAQPVVPMGTLQSHPLTGTLEMDGELDPAWQAVAFIDYAIDDSEQLLAAADYNPDASMRFASLHSSDRLYFFFEVTDDTIVSDSSNLYNDDSIELYIDALNDLSGPYSSDDHWVVIGPEGNYQSLGPSAIEVNGFIKTTPAGYNIEISLSLSALGGNASNLGFNVGINDDDAGDVAVDAYGLWHLPATQNCVDCCQGEASNYAWCDTTRLGQLEMLP